MSGISAIKGFRTQFLYSLHEILTTQNTTLKYKLEGIEDLDKLDDQNHLVEVIQVKNLSSTLTLSDIISKKNTSFIKRLSEVKQKSTLVTGSLISFGNVSNDLTTWIGTKKTVSKREKKAIESYGLTMHEWIDLKQNLSIKTVNEEDLYKKVIDILKEQFPFIDPIPGIKILLYWLSFTAEKQNIITKTSVLAEIQSIGKYLSERIAVENQLGIYITPITSTGNKKSEQQLKDEFYSGISARYDHILHSLDVVRRAPLINIEDGFYKNNIVIVQGASGQGKSALAYRFIKDFCPETLCYELNLQEDAVNTRLAITAINALAKELKVPAYFLINVNTNSVEWIKIVREFASEQHLRFLVTIRQEDWYKATSFGIEFNHTEIELSLDKIEAEQIYLKLNEQNIDLANSDFEEAWIKFGENGPLLEFVYSITKGTSLLNKLRQQVAQINKEQTPKGNNTLELLRIIALSDTFGAKLSAKSFSSIANILDITNRLEKEYLIKFDNNGKYISGLHNLRSKILLTLLFDEVIICKKDYIAKCFQFISPSDVFIFSINCLQERLISPKEIVEHAHELPKTWSVFYQLLRALVWAGACEYVENNILILEEAYLRWGDAWYLFIDFYFGQTLNIENFLSNLDFLPDSVIKDAKKINSRLSNKDEVFGYASSLFKALALPNVPPSNSEGWKGFGGTLFWLKNLPYPNEVTIDFSFDPISLQDIDAETISEVLLGLFYFQDIFSKKIEKLQELFNRKIQEEFNIPYFDVKSDEIKAVYISNPLSNEKNQSLHSYSVRIVNALRKAYPCKQKFTVSALGQHLQIIESDYDESKKSIPIENLPLYNWTALNALVIRRFEFRHSPKDWPEYFKELDLWESDIYNRIIKLNPILKKTISPGSHQKEEYEVIASNIDYQKTRGLKKPQAILDPLGLYGSDKTSDEETEEANDKHKTVKFYTKFDKFFKAKSKFENGIENFIKQSAQYLFDATKRALDNKHEINKNNLHISQVNLFEAVKYFPEFDSQKKLQFSKFYKISKVDQHLILKSAFLYKNFINGNKGLQKVYTENNFYNQIKHDFEKRLIVLCKKHSMKPLFELKYANNIENKPIIFVHYSEPQHSLLGLHGAFNAIKEAIGEIEYTSLKQLMLSVSFEDFYILPTILGHTLNNSWYSLREYTFRKKFDEVPSYNWVPKLINDSVKNTLGLLDWNVIAPKTIDALKFLGRYTKLQFLVQHLADLQEFETYELNKVGRAIFVTHATQFQEDVQQDFQYCIDFMAEIGKQYANDAVNKQSNDEFWQTYIHIRNNIFPKEKGDEVDYQVTLNLDDFKVWAVRLNLCTNYILNFYYLICHRYIDELQAANRV